MTPNQQTSSAATAITNEQRRNIWTKLQDAPAPTQERQRPPRLSFERDGVLVRVTHPAGGCTSRTVQTFDISMGGVGLLYYGYLHVGTAITISLPRRLGGEEKASGRVVWCKHGFGSWHGVGVKFNEPIFIKSFVNPSEWSRLPTGTDVEPQDLVGDVLAVDDQEIDQILFKHMVSNTRLSVTSVSTAQQALNAMKQTKFGLVCTDINLGVNVTKGDQLITSLRSKDYNGPILVISAESQQLEKLSKLTEVSTLAKPYDQQQLLAALGMALGIAGSHSDPIFSEMADKAGVSALLEQFRVGVHQSMREMQQSINADRFEQVRLVCQMLRGSAAGYGFPIVSDAATEAVKALDAGADISEAIASLQKLQSVCRRISSKRPTPES